MSEWPRRTMGLLVAAVLAVASTTGLAASPAGGIPAAVSGGWRVQVSPDVTQPSGVLASVSCTSAHACTGVGSYVNTAGQFVTLAEAWNGTSWRRQPTPDPAGGSNVLFTGVSCASTGLCEAVGSFIVRHGAARLGFAEQWNGRTWTLQSLPAPPGGSSDVEPAAVSCPTATFCEAVGQYQVSPGISAPLAEVWDGTSWRPQHVPSLAGLELVGVTCLSATFCEAVGANSPNGQNAEVWNGRLWLPQSTPAPARAVGLELAAVSCVAGDICEAVGDWLAPGGELPVARTLAEVWNGKAWAIQHTPNAHALPYTSLSGVSCTGPNACEAVGANFDPVSSASNTMAEVWNGVSWRLQGTPGQPVNSISELGSVSCTATNACEAVGAVQQAGQAALAEAWDGSSWTVQRGAAPPGATNNFLNAVSCVTARFCEAVGSGFDHAGIYASLAEVWNGVTWRIQPTPNPAKRSNVLAILNGVSCLSVRFCVAVGESNSTPDLFTEVWNGTSWKIQTAPGTGALTSVSCPSVHFCAAVGSTAAIAGSVAEVDLWNGHSWSAVPPAPGFTSLSSVSCLSASFCEAVGLASSGQDAQVWNGHSWSLQSTPLPAGVSPQNVTFSGVSCAAPAACEAVGGYLTGVLRGATLAEVWNGTAWTIQPTPSPMPKQGPSMSAVWCTSPSSCTAVGIIGSLSTSSTHLTLAEVWDGESWRVQRTPTPNPVAGGGALTGVWCGASLTCFASGDGTDPGGIPATLIEARA